MNASSLQVVQISPEICNQDRRLALWPVCSCYNSETCGQNEKKWQIYTLISNGNVSSWDFKVRLKGFVLPTCTTTTTTTTAAATTKHNIKTQSTCLSSFLLFLCLLLNTVSASVKATVVQVSEPIKRCESPPLPPLPSHQSVCSHGNDPFPLPKTTS